MTIKDYLKEYILKKYPGVDPVDVFGKFHLDMKIVFQNEFTAGDERGMFMPSVKHRIDELAEEVKNADNN